MIGKVFAVSPVVVWAERKFCLTNGQLILMQTGMDELHFIIFPDIIISLNVLGAFSDGDLYWFLKNSLSFIP